MYKNGPQAQSIFSAFNIYLLCALRLCLKICAAAATLTDPQGFGF
ncbi:unnamed protein product [Rhodiola kirilowii]